MYACNEYGVIYSIECGADKSRGARTIHLLLPRPLTISWRILSTAISFVYVVAGTRTVDYHIDYMQIYVVPVFSQQVSLRF